MKQRICIIDIENLQPQDFSFFEQNKYDRVVAYYRNSNISKKYIEMLSNAKVEIQKIEKKYKSTNCTDEFIMMECVRLATIADYLRNDLLIHILSKDRDMEKAVGFIKEKFNSDFISIKIINYLPEAQNAIKIDNVNDFMYFCKEKIHLPQAEMRCLENIFLLHPNMCSKNKNKKLNGILNTIVAKKKESKQNKDLFCSFIKSQMAIM